MSNNKQDLQNQSLPKGIKFLSGTEMWERFSYYGIMSILILYLSKSLGLSDERSGIIVGTYIAFTWMSPVLGGWLADNFLGQVNAIRIGGIGIFLGNLILAVGIGGLNGFFVGLSVIILGTGLLKSSISIIVGQMFDDGDPRIDRAYTIFYMFINIGATMSAAISQIAESSGDWRLGFAMSTVGMLLGLFIFYMGRRYYKMYPRVQSKPALHQSTFGISNKVLIGVGLLIAIPILLFFFLQPQVTNYFMLLISLVVIANIVWHWTRYKTRREKIGILAILIYVIFQIFYFSLYQQVNDSIILFMDRVVDLNIFGFEISSGSASLLFNSVFIIILAPILASIYAWLGKRNMEPSTPVKFFLSISVMAVCFLIFALEAKASASTGIMASVWTTILGFIVFSISDVLSGPISLSLIAQLSPKKIAGFMMGANFFAMAAGGYVSGLITSYFGSPDPDKTTLAQFAASYYEQFLICCGGMAVIAVIYIIAIPYLKKAHKIVASEETE